MNLFNHIQEHRSQLRPSERIVAQYILRHAREVVHMSMSALAEANKVSEPTVQRFCHALGYSGFRSFKDDLLREISVLERFIQSPVVVEDKPDNIVSKVVDSSISRLLDLRSSLDLVAIERAVDLLQGCSGVEIYAFGGSVPLALDMQHKLFRLQMRVGVHSDPHMQRMSLHSLKPSDVVVAISNSGATSALLDSVSLAIDSKTPVIALTDEDTPLAGLSTVALTVQKIPEDQILQPLTSRLVRLTMIDILVAILAVRQGENAQVHLEQLMRSQEPLRAHPQQN